MLSPPVSSVGAQSERGMTDGGEMLERASAEGFAYADVTEGINECAGLREPACKVPTQECLHGASSLASERHKSSTSSLPDSPSLTWFE